MTGNKYLCKLTLATLFLSIAGAAPIVHQVTLPSGMTWCDDTMINGLSTLLNTFRGQNNVSALSISTLGMKDAELRAVQFAQYMTTNPPGSPGFDPHTGWDTTAAGIGYNVVSENLAYITTDPNYIVYSVWQDPLHLAAMLAGDANVMGVSCVYYNATPYWTYEPGSCSGSSCTTQPPSGNSTPDSEDWNFLTLINNYRAQNGVGPLQVSQTLENASSWMSNDMATNNYASHTDSLGRATGTRLAAFNYSYTPWGENIAGGYSDAQTTFTQWQTACDPDANGNCTYAHRANMLNPSFHVIGIARAYNANSTYGWYWTTDFGGYVDQIIPPPSSGGSAPTISSFTAAPASITAGQSATLSWSVAGATTLTIDNGVGDVSTATSRSVTPAQTTAYTLTATNSSGSATARTTVTVTTVPDTQPPTAPTLTSAVAKSSGEVDLAWTASTDNVGVAGYQIQRNGAPVTSVAGTSLTYADTSVTPSTTYTYSVCAYDAAGNYSTASNTIQVTTPAAVVNPGCPAPATSAFTGCYYPNITLSGSPVLTRTDPQINFDWSVNTPALSLPPENFSVRWQGYFTFSAASYTFTATTSDGMRVYIDGNIVLNEWFDQPGYVYTFQQSVTQGSHLVTVEYYEHSGISTAHLTWQSSTPVTQPPTILSFTATPASIAAGQSSTLSWSVNGAASVTIDNGIGDVSTATSRAVSPAQTTTYTLTAANSAGSVTAKATVTVTTVPDTQPPTQPTLTSAVAKSSGEVDLAWTASTDNVGVAGYQVLRNGAALTSVGGATLTYADTSVAPNAAYTYSVRAFDAAGNYSTASNTIQVTTPPAPVTGTCPGPATNAFTGCYYNNMTMSGNPAVVRTDPQINFDWGTGVPDPAITPEDFSVRWQGYFTFNQAAYTFTAITSDGMRIYIDGNIILDKWRDQPGYVYTVQQPITQGPHLVTVEYYEHTGLPIAHVTWQ